MADMLSLDELGAAIFKMVKQSAGLKKFKMMDILKTMKEMYPGRVDKQSVKDAIKQEIESGRLVYTYFGGSYIEIPHTEAAANPDRK